MRRIEIFEEDFPYLSVTTRSSIIYRGQTYSHVNITGYTQYDLQIISEELVNLGLLLLDSKSGVEVLKSIYDQLSHGNFDFTVLLDIGLITKFAGIFKTTPDNYNPYVPSMSADNFKLYNKIYQ